MPKADIPEGWKMTTLGEVAEVNALTINKDYHFDEIEYIDVASVKERKLLQTQKLILESAPSRAKRIVRDDDILISTVRPNLKHFCFIKTSKPNLIASTGFAVISAKRAHPYFLYNLLTTEKYTEYLTQVADTHTSTYPAFNPEVILNSKFLLPSLTEQRAIAAVLSSLDDKIELLREQNKTLEAIAQAIFKHWFIDFEFPDKNGNPYKSSGGKMIESELGDIPEGWKIGKISDLIDILPGFAFSSSSFCNNGRYKLVTIKNVQDRFFLQKTKDRLDKLPEKMPSYCKLNCGDILLSLTGNIGRVCLVIGDDYLLNQRVARLSSKNENDIAFPFLLFIQDSIFNTLQNIASGTAQQNLSPIKTGLVKIIIPTRKILDKLGIPVNKLIQKITDNSFQIQTLSALRDSLLPRLMSGKIRVHLKG
jgi:type I restriction enzyme S subunit